MNETQEAIIVWAMENHAEELGEHLDLNDEALREEALEGLEEGK